MARLLWTQKQDIGPKRRVGHSMAFDAARGRVVLFGGDSLGGVLFKDTWEWDGENWTQTADMGPRARAYHSMAYDSLRQRVVLFGGSEADSDLRDTWEWDGEDWTQISDTGPSPRSRFAMAFDEDHARAILFSGSARKSAPIADTWAWDGVDWIQIEDTGPPPRINHVMAYDTDRRRTVLFGGSSPGVALGDTWEWNGSTWTQVAHFGPDPCASAAAAFAGGRVKLFGGVGHWDEAVKVFGSTWEWDGHEQHWTERQDIGPGPRWCHALAYDSARNRIVFFGGLPTFADDLSTVRDRVLGDTWEHTPTVSLVSIAVAPPFLRHAQTNTGTITLSGPAPATGLTIGISSNLDDNELWFGASPSVSPGPKQILIAANASIGTFYCKLHAGPPGANSASINATLAGKSITIPMAIS